ncbi:MAG: sulfotransferase [Magnetococcales bacterium]|nr:sulfotransferase [Magnetococcales bacterium]
MTGSPPPIFIVGSPRSGTTLLQRILSAADEVVAMPETHFFEIAFPPLYSFQSWPIRRKIVCSTLAAGDIARISQALGSRGVDTSALTGTETRPEELFEHVVAAYRRRSEGSRFLEKTPNHVYYLDEIRRLFPESVILGIVRNPHDVISSMKRMIRSTKPPDRSIREYFQMWEATTRIVVGSGIPFVTYEELVRTPRPVVAEACRICGIPFTDTLLDTYHRKNDVITPQHMDGWMKNTRRPVIDRSGKAREELSSAELALVDHYLAASPLAARFPPLAPGTKPGRTSLGLDLLTFLLARTRVAFHTGKRGLTTLPHRLRRRDCHLAPGTRAA